MIIGSFYLVPRIGIGAFFVLLVAGKLLAAMVFGQFDLFGAPATAMILAKAAGAVLVVAGVWMVTYR